MTPGERILVAFGTNPVNSPNQTKKKMKKMTQANHTLHSNQVVEGDQNAPLDISFLTYQS
jgi:hypothetical protein